MSQCYCGDRYRCEDCRRDVCYCVCEKDGTPETTTAGYVNPSAALQAAYDEKLELTR